MVAPTLKVSDETFGKEFNQSLVHQVVTAYRNGGRAGTKAQLTKAEVRGGGRKPRPQKGGGTSRAGSIRSPIWVGGGRAFAAKPRDFAQKVNKKMYRGAIQSMLSELVRQDRLVVTQAFTVDAPKTKLVAAELKKLRPREGAHHRRGHRREAVPRPRATCRTSKCCRWPC